MLIRINTGRKTGVNMVLKPPLPKFLWRPAAGAYFERIPNAPTVQFEAQTMPNSEESVICGRFEGFGDHFQAILGISGVYFSDFRLETGVRWVCN